MQHASRDNHSHVLGVFYIRIKDEVNGQEGCLAVVLFNRKVLMRSVGNEGNYPDDPFLESTYLFLFS